MSAFDWANDTYSGKSQPEAKDGSGGAMAAWAGLVYGAENAMTQVAFNSDSAFKQKESGEGQSQGNTDRASADDSRQRMQAMDDSRNNAAASEMLAGFSLYDSHESNNTNDQQQLARAA